MRSTVLHHVQVKKIEVDKQDIAKQLAEKTAQLRLLLSHRDSSYKVLKVLSALSLHFKAGNSSPKHHQ